MEGIVAYFSEGLCEGTEEGEGDSEEKVDGFDDELGTSVISVVDNDDGINVGKDEGRMLGLSLLLVDGDKEGIVEGRADIDG